MFTSLKAIFTGVIVDLLGTVLGQLGLSMFLGMALSLYWTGLGMSGPMVEYKVEQLSKNITVLIIMVLIGLLFSALGGFFAAMLSNGKELLNAGIVGVFSIIFGIASLFILTHPHIPLAIIGITLSMPAALFGGYPIYAINHRTSYEYEYGEDTDEETDDEVSEDNDSIVKES